MAILNPPVLIFSDSMNDKSSRNYWANKKTLLTRSIWYGQQGLSIKLITNKRSNI